MSGLTPRWPVLVAMERWLPWPVYRFWGGPFHGTMQEVQLMECADGVYPPRYHRMAVPALDREFKYDDAISTEEDAVFETCLYKFVQHGDCGNQGYYQFVPGGG